MAVVAAVVADPSTASDLLSAEKQPVHNLYASRQKRKHIHSWRVISQEVGESEKQVPLERDCPNSTGGGEGGWRGGGRRQQSHEERFKCLVQLVPEHARDVRGRRQHVDGGRTSVTERESGEK